MTKQLCLAFVDNILQNDSILRYTEEISALRLELNTLLTPEENYALTSKIKNKIQDEALKACRELDKSIVIAATGVGKTKIAIDRMNRYTGERKFMVVVPTQKLRDFGWASEISNWGQGKLLNSIQLICYDSLHTVKKEHFDLVIFDECHNFTENSVQFITDNDITKVMGLSATYPTNPMRAKLVTEHIGSVCYSICTDAAVKLGVVSPYNIIIINVPLYKIEKGVKAGSKAKPFMTTEEKNYLYLEQLCEATPTKFNYLKRMRFIYNLKSKERAAKWLLAETIPNDIRTLIFAGSKKQANELCDNRYYSKPSKPKKGNTDAEATKQYEEEMMQYRGSFDLDLFLDQKLNRLSCVEALNEGHNIDNIDCGLVVQLNSNELNLIQRIGRCIRYRVDHVGTIIIFCSNETVDRQWVKKATANLNMNTREINFKDLLEGNETINF